MSKAILKNLDSGQLGMKKRRFRIIDDCGWTHIIETDRPDLMAADIVLLVPHVRSAAEITDAEEDTA